VVIAIIVIVALVLFSNRGANLLGRTGTGDPLLVDGPDTVLDPAPIDPNVPDIVDPNQPVEPESDIVVDPGAITTTSPVARPPIRLEDVAGFGSGVLHGLISPFTLVLSFFMDNIRMYDPTNMGPAYDVGFLLGLILLLALTQVGRYRGYYRRRRAD